MIKKLIVSLMVLGLLTACGGSSESSTGGGTSAAAASSSSSTSNTSSCAVGRYAFTTPTMEKNILMPILRRAAWSIST